jgi:hypothetical protein
MSEQKTTAVLPHGAHSVARQLSAAPKVESWLRRADAILAGTRFDPAAALTLVQEIRNEAGPGGIGSTAAQALGSLQAARSRATNTWPLSVAKQRFELVRKALAHRAPRS